MTEQYGASPSANLERIVESARRLGVELDEVINVDNNFFQDRFTNLPAIQTNMEQIHSD